ncbi:MAG: hypothetical protein LBJ00_01890 [Planctomycetaceae bacterium]|jgi:hypothetical protein|nr:hypothetical protein [Planctomycetaceae bacterium]
MRLYTVAGKAIAYRLRYKRRVVLKFLKLNTEARRRKAVVQGRVQLPVLAVVYACCTGVYLSYRLRYSCGVVCELFDIFLGENFCDEDSSVR